MKTGGEVYSSPAIGNDGTIYITSSDGHLYAIRPSGNIRWRTDLGYDLLVSSPAIASDGTVYVGSWGYLYSINQDGSIRWRLPMGVPSSPTIDMNGTIYVTAEYTHLVAVYPNGTVKWTVEIGDNTQSSVAIADDGTLYVKGGSHNPEYRGSTELLYAFSAKGSKVWQRTITLDSNVTAITGFSSPSIGKDGTIYIGSDDNHLFAYSPEGEMKWTFNAEGAVVVSPTIGLDGTIYIGNWINATNNKVPDHNYLCAVNPDGSLKWKFRTELPICSSPSIGADGTVYFGSDNYSETGSGRESGASFYAVDANGHLKWKIETGTVVSSPAIDKDGSVYFGSVDGYVCAVKGGSPPLGPKILLPIGGMMLLAVVFAVIVLEGNRRK
jgi:outer membrane protein assembly factor BamB